MDIGKIIRNGRVRAGLSQGELGEKFGIKQSQVSKWENGESTPTGTDLIKLAILLDIVEDIFPGYEKAQNNHIKREEIDNLNKRIYALERQLIRQ